MISCRQSTEWVIKKEHGKLSVKENLQLLSHLSICSICKLFAQQSKLINKAISKTGDLIKVSFSPAEKKDLFILVVNKAKH